MRSGRIGRPLLAAWLLTAILATLNVVVALADSGGGPFPH
jgi:hypothetical protein